MNSRTLARFQRRFFRLYSKKRGRRRTGSPMEAGALLAGFFAVCLIGGSALLYLLVSRLIIPEWRVNHRFISTQGEVLDTKLEESDAQKSPSFRPRVLVSYEAGGASHTAWTFDIDGIYSPNREEQLSRLAPFEKSKPCTVWFDPRQPATVVVVRGYKWYLWLLLLLPASFITVGAGGLIYMLVTFGKSAERRAASATLPSALEMFEPAVAEDDDFPTVPRDTTLRNSPGTQLRYRLPTRTRWGWTLALWLASAVAFNIAWIIFAAMAVRAHYLGEQDWYLTLFTVPWVIAGAVSGVYGGRQLLIAAGVGPTIVEISDEPLFLGETYRLSLSQSGRLKVTSLRMNLVCQERATYQQGTNTRLHERRVVEIEVFHRERFTIVSKHPLVEEFDLRLPHDAMHSFRSDHNEVAWKLITTGELEGWPDFEREFPLVVHPPRQEGSR